MSPVDTLRRLFADAERDVRLAAQDTLLSTTVASIAVRRTGLARIFNVLAHVRAIIAPQAHLVAAAAYTEGTRVALDALPEAPVGPPGLPPRPPATGLVDPGDIADEAIRILADNMTTSLDRAVLTVGRRAQDAFRREGLRHSAAMLARGESVEVASEGLQRFLRDQGIQGFTDRAGREWSLRAYADMVIRTTSQEALSHGTINTCLAQGHDLLTIPRHAGACPICIPFEGITYSITGLTPGYPRLIRIPPLHPHCTHSLEPA